MKKPDNLKNLRVSTAAVAKILWNAIDAGADAKTMHAICDYISDPAADTPEVEVYAPAYDEAVAETDRSARRCRAAREAAARRRAARDSHNPQPEATEPEAVQPDVAEPDVVQPEPVKVPAPPRPIAVTPARRRYLERVNGIPASRSKKRVQKL